MLDHWIARFIAPRPNGSDGGSRSSSNSWLTTWVHGPALAWVAEESSRRAHGTSAVGGASSTHEGARPRSARDRAARLHPVWGDCWPIDDCQSCRLATQRDRCRHRGSGLSGQRNPPDPSCAPRAVVGALIEAVDAGGHVVARATTAADGSYVLTVGETGTLTITAQPVAGFTNDGARDRDPGLSWRHRAG